MFLDRYFVVHDINNAKESDDLAKRRFPRIGIYNKRNPQVYTLPDGTIPKPIVDPTKGNTDAASGGLGAGWVIFILLIVFGGIGAIYKFYGK